MCIYISSTNITCRAQEESQDQRASEEREDYRDNKDRKEKLDNVDKQYILWLTLLILYRCFKYELIH